MNKITFTGRLGADVDMKYAASGDAIANFKVASDVGYGDKKSTNWFACALFGKRAEALAQYLTKGLPVTIFGSLTLREWTNKDGVKMLSPDVRVDEVELHGTKKSDNEPAPRQQAQPRSRPPAGLDEFVDSIPF